MNARENISAFQSDRLSPADASPDLADAWGKSGNRNIATTPRAGLRGFDAWQLCVWVYRDQKAHVVEGESVGPARLRAAAGWTDYGCLVEGGGGLRRPLLHPAAEAVAAFVQREGLGDLVRWAARGEAPDWIAVNPLWPVWRSGEKDRPPPARNTTRGKRSEAALLILRHPSTGGRYCAVEPRFSAAQVGWVRRDYRNWWEAVKAVEAHFRARPELLTGIDLLPFDAPAEPWAGPESSPAACPRRPAVLLEDRPRP